MAKAKKESGRTRPGAAAAEEKTSTARKKPWTEREVMAEVASLQDRAGRFKALAKKMQQVEIGTFEIDGDADLR